MRWQNLKADYVRTATVDGKRLVLDFAIDFKKKFNREICISCVRQFNNDFLKYINAMSEQKVNYRLKGKYNNISLGFGKRGRLSNENMNEDDAIFLLKHHPKGKGLFDILPPEPERLKKPEPEKKINKRKSGK